MKTRLVPTIAITALAGLAVAGCGGLDTDEGEEKISDAVKQQTGAKDVSVDCPDDVDQKKGENFDCKVTGDATGTVQVTQTNDDGNVTFDLSQVTAGKIK